MGLLAGKRVAILGVANRRSIAATITETFAREGARISLSYQSDRLKDGVEAIGSEFGVEHIAQCDVAEDASVEAYFASVGEALGGIDALVHSIAYVPTEELKGRYIETTREGSRIAHEISADSFRLLARYAEPLLSEGASLMTLTYLGSTFAFPHYNVMGAAKASLEATVRYLALDLGPKKVRVNAISAPPTRTLAARQIPGLAEMISSYEAKAPLGVPETDAVADVALFLASDLSRSMSAEVLICDGGYSRMGL